MRLERPRVRGSALRVLMVNTCHFRGGGDSTYAFNLADLLRSHGHQVAFFAMSDRRNEPDASADMIVSNIDFRELNRHKSPGTALKVLNRSIYSREARHKFGLLIDRFVPDIVHLQNIHGHITPSVILEAKKMGLPVVWTLHDYKLICPNTHFLNDKTNRICEACGRGAYYQPMLKRCKKGSLLASGVASLEAYAHRLMHVRERVDAFLAPSTFLRDKLVERGFPLSQVHHMPLFLPTEAFWNGGEDDGYVLFLGKLDPIKGFYQLIDACRLAPDVKLILAGSGETSIVAELPRVLPRNAGYVGMKSGDELRRLLQKALAVVLPSLWYENQPMSILEAFACGKPVVASDIGGIPELVRDGDRGLLVPPGDVQSLVGAIRWISGHPVEARRMGQNAQHYAAAVHGSEQHYQSLMGIYATVARGQQGNGRLGNLDLSM